MDLLLIEQAQSALSITFDGKPLSLQPFLNAVSADVTACHLQEAATICNNPTLPGLAATDPNINILTGYGNVTDEIMTFYFDDLRRNQIRGTDDAGNLIDPNLLGADINSRSKSCEFPLRLFHPMRTTGVQTSNAE